MTRKATYLLVALVVLLVVSVPAMAVTRTVKQAGGGNFTTVTAAVNAAASGDIIEVQDSGYYYEAITIPAGKNNLTIQGKEGESPFLVTPTTSPANWTLLQISATGCTIKNMGFYNDGEMYGINIAGSNTTITGCSFDAHIAPRHAGYGTYCIYMNGTTATVIDSNFVGDDSMACGGILAGGTISLTVNVCDFYCIGTSGGCIGLGANAGSVIAVQNTCFSNWRTGRNIVGINAWVAPINITESDNTYFNIDYALGSNNYVNNGTINSVSSWRGTGTDAVSDSPVAINMSHIDNFLMFNSVMPASDATLSAYTGPGALSDYLNKTIRMINYRDFFYGMTDPVLGVTVGQKMRNMVVNTGCKHWECFDISWGQQYNPATWKQIKDYAAEVHNLRSDCVLGGFLMEAINKANLENTPIPNWIWCWMARWTRNIPMRPIEVKVINGHRLQGHFWDYETMLGIGVNQWGTDVSVPNLTKQEALMYYLYLAREYINAGMNEISFGEPQLTFSQCQTNNVTGGDPFKMVTKFAKNYALGYGYQIGAKKFAIIEANTIVYYLKNYSNFVDYVMSPMGADSIGTGVNLSSLSDSWNHIPPSSIGLTGKPICLETDNYGVGDQISRVAEATPATRNSWLISFTSSIKSSYGYYMAQPGVIPMGSVGAQNFTGAPQVPQVWNGSWVWPWAYYYWPWNEYGGTESTTQYIFGL